MARRRRHGSGEVYESSPGSWAVRWRETGRRRFKAGFTTRADAERVLIEIRRNLAMGEAGVPMQTPGAKRRLGDLIDGWLATRDVTRPRTATEYRRRWRMHLAPHFARLRPDEVDAGTIRKFIEDRLTAGLAPGTVGLLVYQLSAMFNDLVEDKAARFNPCRALPRGTRDLFKGDHRPQDTPYVERLDDVRRIYLALREPVRVAYALGAMAGLRTGEIIALRWESVDLVARRMTVRATADRLTSEEVATKDGDVRVVPILDGLLPVLTAWRVKTGGRGLMVPPMQRTAGHISRDVLWEGLRDALRGLGFPEEAWTPEGPRTLTWYRSTRHTFASHWVLAGGSLATLARILGHASVTITERHYVHLRPDLYADRDLGTIALDLRPGAAAVVTLPAAAGPEDGQRLTRAQGPARGNR